MLYKTIHVDASKTTEAKRSLRWVHVCMRKEWTYTGAAIRVIGGTFAVAWRVGRVVAALFGPRHAESSRVVGVR